MEQEERTAKETEVYALLDRLGMYWERIDHEAAVDMHHCEEISRRLGAKICKNLFLCNRQHTRFYLLLMPGEKAFKTKDLSCQIQSARLSFAEPEYMEKYLHTQPGSASVMGLMNDRENQVELLIEEDILKEEYLGCHPCVNTSSLKLKTREVIGTFLPAVHHTYRVVVL